MITSRSATARGVTELDWLDSRHTFSFGAYHDPAHMGFRSLRVLNEDRVRPGAGFATHGHRDMEILSYVLEGALEHQDSTGGGGVLRPGEVQFMRAGTGVTHSEFNASPTDPLHFLQVWILPRRRGLAPRYDQRAFDLDAARAGFVLLASSDGRDGSIQVEQDAAVWVTLLDGGDERAHRLAPGRHAWLHVARGSVRVGGHALGAGDAAALVEEPAVRLAGAVEAEVLLFDLG